MWIGTAVSLYSCCHGRAVEFNSAWSGFFYFTHKAEMTNRAYPLEM